MSYSVLITQVSFNWLSDGQFVHIQLVGDGSLNNNLGPKLYLLEHTRRFRITSLNKEAHP